MQPPSYLLPRPAFELGPEKQAAFEDLYRSTRKSAEIVYTLPHPKWQFLSYLCDTKELVLHGSQVLDIAVVEPRKANDVRDYSNQSALYASTDGIWVIYFAIVDRRNHPGLSLFNSCLRARLSPDELSDPFYFFSISQFALAHKPWCDGMVYILPRTTFQREAALQVPDGEIVFPHWISYTPVESLAKLRVGPQDFPFLDRIHGHNDARLEQLYKSDPGGFPLEALES